MRDSDVDEFAAALKLAEGGGTLLVDIDLQSAVCIIAIIQLACRHPGTRGMHARDVAERFARLMQEELGRRNADLGRLLERGWHPVFDVPREDKSTQP